VAAATTNTKIPEALIDGSTFGRVFVLDAV